MTKGSNPGYDWDGKTIFDLDELIEANPSLALVEEEITEWKELPAGYDEGGDCGCGGCGCNEIEAKATPKELIFDNPGEAMKP